MPVALPSLPTWAYTDMRIAIRGLIDLADRVSVINAISRQVAGGSAVTFGSDQGTRFDVHLPLAR